MIFNRTYRLRSKKSATDLRTEMVGKHLQIHELDFEVFDNKEQIKIIPHAEEKEGILTLPITNIKLAEKSNATTIDIETHPRKIDIGGPYILLILCAAIFFSGYLLGIYGGPEFSNTCKLMMAIGLGTFAVFWVRMELGYFDYVRKIKRWVQQNA